MSTGDENKQVHQQRDIILMYYQILRTSLKEVYACQEGELVFLALECTGKLSHHLGVPHVRLQFFPSPALMAPDTSIVVSKIKRKTKLIKLRFPFTKDNF